MALTRDELDKLDPRMISVLKALASKEPTSTIDFEQVDMRLLSMLMTLQSIQDQAAALDLTGTADLVNAVDTYRNHVGLEIEKQGARK